MTDWSSWVGRRTVASARLDPAQADRLNATLDREPGFARGDELPPAWHWLYFPEVARAGELGPEGHPRLGLTMPPIPLPRRMWAGGDLEFRRPLLVGSLVERVSTIRAVTPKQGRSGPLFFVTVEHELYRRPDTADAGGGPDLVERQTIVYRELSAAPARGQGEEPEPAPRDGEFSATWALDPVALFRYSALTFNGHRIHYDVDYCRQVEGYPGLVVHGPLLATLLLDLARRAGRPVGRFEYTARSPLFLPGAFTVNGRADGDATSLWAAGPDGRLAMRARTQPSP